MRTLVFIILLLTSTMTFSETTIHTVIKKDRHFVASWWEKALRLNNDFPQKQYKTTGIRLTNPLYHHEEIKDVHLKNSALIFATLKLNLISYDKSSGSYKFNLSIPEAGIEYQGKYQKIPADVYFDKYQNKTILLTGKLEKVPSGALAMPKIHKGGTEDFILSVDEIKDITISSQHDVPISITLHD